MGRCGAIVRVMAVQRIRMRLYNTLGHLQVVSFYCYHQQVYRWSRKSIRDGGSNFSLDVVVVFVAVPMVSVRVLVVAHGQPREGSRNGRGRMR